MPANHSDCRWGIPGHRLPVAGARYTTFKKSPEHFPNHFDQSSSSNRRSSSGAISMRRMELRWTHWRWIPTKLCSLHVNGAWLIVWLVYCANIQQTSLSFDPNDVLQLLPLSTRLTDDFGGMNSRPRLKSDCRWRTVTTRGSLTYFDRFGAISFHFRNKTDQLQKRDISQK